MHRKAQGLLLCFLGSAAFSCSMPTDRAAAAIKSGRSENAASAFSKGIEELGFVAFRSTGDINDCGTEVTFFQGNRVEILDLGYVGIGYSGSFELSGSGTIEVILEDPETSWVTMVLDQRDGQLRLWPYESGFACGMPDMPSEYEASYWPYQLLDDTATD